MKYLIPLLNFAVAAAPYVSIGGVSSTLNVWGSVAFGFVGIVTAAWAYGKADMPVILTGTKQ